MRHKRHFSYFDFGRFLLVFGYVIYFFHYMHLPCFISFFVLSSVWRIFINCSRNLTPIRFEQLWKIFKQIILFNTMCQKWCVQYCFQIDHILYIWSNRIPSVFLFHQKIIIFFLETIYCCSLYILSLPWRTLSRAQNEKKYVEYSRKSSSFQSFGAKSNHVD